MICPYKSIKNVNKSQIYFLDAQVKGQGDRPVILLFNSIQYSSNMWLKLGVIHELAQNGSFPRLNIF